jgi:Lipocalin-like domain
MTDLNGTWSLTTWRRIAGDGSVSYPLGADAHGLLLYTENGRMTVQIAASNRVVLASDDPLGGDTAARAAAYSTYLAYFGTYEVQGQEVVHNIDGSLFPNWSGVKQVRPFTAEFDQLVLRTPPMTLADGTTVVNELAWERDKRLCNRELSE